MVVLAEPGVTPPVNPFTIFATTSRPQVKEYIEAIGMISHDEDINIITNTDCFLAEEDTTRVFALPSNAAYCLSRVEIKSIDPIRQDWWKNRYTRHKHPMDTQDCWIVRGMPSQGMALEFPLGAPGCDNRIAFELQQAGYRIINPASIIRLYHYHRDRKRSYAETERVPGPYAFPERM